MSPTVTDRRPVQSLCPPSTSPRRTGTRTPASTSRPASDVRTEARTTMGDARSACEIRTNTKLPAVPDLHGVRYCRVCRDFLPVSRFPRGPRRFTCRTHLWQRTGQKATKALLMACCACGRRATRIRSSSVGHTRIALTQRELDALLDAYACSGGCGNGHSDGDGDRYGEAGSRTAGAVDRLDKLAVVPIDRAKLLCIDNAFLVTKDQAARAACDGASSAARNLRLELACWPSGWGLRRSRCHLSHCPLSF